KYYLTNKQNITSQNEVDFNKNNLRRGNSKKLLMKSFYKNVIKKILFKEEYKIIEDNFEYIKIGKFRLSGEIHQWMYDRYSLSTLLARTGFKEIQIMSAYESKINDWNKFQLDVIDGEIRKPDSLFIEAIKQY
ncbi:MAG: methyltransferase, partial [Bacteroidota bacterium]|nr:methyltransferase [Bacteroidota bacterium]